jgi:hypothetical protein
MTRGLLGGVVDKPYQRRSGRGCQQPAQTALGEPAGRGGDQDQSIRVDRPLCGGLADVAQRHHPAHRVPDKSDRAANPQRNKDIGEIAGELLDPGRCSSAEKAAWAEVLAAAHLRVGGSPQRRESAHGRALE